MSKFIAMKSLFFITLFVCLCQYSWSQAKYESDVFKTSSGDLKITFIGHGTLMFEFKKLVIHVDPWSSMADYSKLPKADIILVTHHHIDHLDKKAIDLISKDGTELLLTDTCKSMIGKGTVISNGEIKKVKGITVKAVPAYNLVHMTEAGKPYHQKGVCNGYVITFGNKNVYVAGDTENIPEMKALKNIDITFLPMNLPYTMTPEMVADAVKMFNPKIVYPYHYGSAEYCEKLVDLLKDKKNTEVRIRKF